MTEPLIGTGNLEQGMLSGQVAIVTGAGRGIGFEAARALVWLGAKVVVAELDPSTGAKAARRIIAEHGPGTALFVRTDVGDERHVARLARQVRRAFGRVDIVLNNATTVQLGAAKDVPIQKWDRGYRVNLRGPVLLARAFLPEMLARGRGVFVCVSSAGAAPFMGPYEVFKTAQVELANTLDAELEGTGVIAFTIGPGLVRTPGAQEGIRQLAPLYGKTVEEFYALSEAHQLSAEAAGAGFAAAVALAPRFAGHEIGSAQALIAAGIDYAGHREQPAPAALSGEAQAEALALCREARATFAGQVRGMAERSLFERQWVARDFRKCVGMPAEECLDVFGGLEAALAAGDAARVSAGREPVRRLEAYYAHLQELAQGYEKDPVKLKEQLAIIAGWRRTLERLAAVLAKDGERPDGERRDGSRA